ncbi:MAG: tetratricopeptide repeat-containing sensor histidine kinase [Ignavibacteria bacterium]|nr:tetratricopeptide repeat-containing sensor histidine kinase [Ignavibacteria bacterium]
MRKILVLIILLNCLSVIKAQIRNPADSLIEKLQLSSDTGKIEILVDLSTIHLNISLDQSKVFLEQARDLNNRLKYKPGFILINNCEAYIQLLTESYNNAMDLLNESIEIATKENLIKELAYTYTCMGEVAFFQYDYLLALKSYLIADSLYKRTDAPTYQIRNYLLLCNLFNKIKEYDTALEYLAIAQNIAEQKSMLNEKAAILNQIGYINFKKGEFDKVEEYYIISAELGNQSKNYVTLAQTYTFWGSYYIDVMKDFNTAINYYRKALDIYTQINFRSPASTIYTKLSHIYMLQKDYENDIKYNEEALRLRTELGNPVLIASSLLNLGNALKNKNELTKAREYLLAGLDTSLRHRKIDMITSGYQKLYELSILENRDKEALEYYKLYDMYKDSIRAQETINLVSQYQIKYDIERKNSELKTIELKSQQDKQILYIIIIIISTLSGILILIGYIQNKKVNKELKRINLSLDNIIKERTKELEQEITERKKTEEKLKEALKNEKYLNEMKSHFISIVSHEFRTPLAGIDSSLELIKLSLQNNNLLEQNKKFILRIKKEIQKLLGMIVDVLLIGKYEAGKFEFNPKKTDIKSTLERIIDEFEKSKPDRKLHFEFTSNGKEKLAEIDENIFYHIINNLLSNAEKYTLSDDNPNVELNFFDNYYEIIVSDKGIGIPPEEQKFIFNSFFRASNTTGINGTGLGLIIVKQFVELHKGTIEFESKLNEGTTFRIHLPYEITEK